MRRVQEHLTESIFVHFQGQGNLISKGYFQFAAKCTNYIEAMFLFLVFVTK